MTQREIIGRWSATETIERDRLRAIEIRSAVLGLAYGISQHRASVFISRALYMAGVQAGLDMRHYEILKPIPIDDARVSIYRHVNIGESDTLHPDQHFTGERVIGERKVPLTNLHRHCEDRT